MLKKIPESAFDLIDELALAYPPRPPRLTATDREVWFEAGQREVVEILLALKAKQTSKRKVVQTDPEEYDPFDDGDE